MDSKYDRSVVCSLTHSCKSVIYFVPANVERLTIFTCASLSFQFIDLLTVFCINLHLFQSLNLLVWGFFLGRVPDRLSLELRLVHCLQ